ncbi:MAG: adenylate/guanylate cyclase domain-containing protein [Anaerolineae bacterium]|nr:adenylate/guanylate cyclase domain-containing protein [Anaerolineae bacterium]
MRAAFRRRPLRWTLPGAILLALLLLQWWQPGWAARAELWSVDARFTLRGQEAPRFPIIIVALDESSAQSLGDLRGENIRMWPRSRWAELVEKIDALNPRLIGIDVMFDVPDPCNEANDVRLSEAIAAAGNVVLVSHLEHTGYFTYELTTLSPPIASLDLAAAGSGLVDLPLDDDGSIRRLVPVYSWEGQNHPTFSLVLATLYNGAPVRVDARDLQPDSALPINFRGPERTFRTVSMVDVLEGALSAGDARLFEDAIVLVGYTTLLEQDRHFAPFSTRQDSGDEGIAGVEIHANVIDTLLAGDWLRRPPAWLSITLVAVAGLVALAVLNLNEPARALLILSGYAAAYLIAGQLFFIRADFILPMAAPVAAAVAVGGAALGERWVFVEHEKRHLRQRFAGMMSEERLEAVMERWDRLLEAERPQKEAAILFADIRGFTSATETLMREGRIAEMVCFLTTYIDTMSEAVCAEGGVIYDIVGDGLMILFGVPEPDPEYARQAVKAAVDMALATETLQEAWPLRDCRPFGMGIGVHCGPVVDAVVGRGRRVKYAVIGDPVNTAARIESHCKAVMELPRPPGGQVPETVTILLSDRVYAQVREHVLVDESVPPFEARGKAEALEVVRLLGVCKDDRNCSGCAPEQ